MEEVKLQTLFLIFFIAIMIDFLTGILAAAKEGKLKSRTCSNDTFTYTSKHTVTTSS